MDKTKKISLFIFGLDRAGKTTIIEFLRQKKFIPQNRPTLGVQISQLIFQNLQLEVFDAGGQANVRSQWEIYLQKPHVLVFVIDATDKDQKRIQEARGELDRILRNPRVSGIPLLVLVNKIDEPTGMSKRAVQEKYNLENNVMGGWNRDTAIYEVSGAQGTNIAAALNAMTSMVLKDEAIEYFVNEEIKIQSKHMLSTYKDLIQKGNDMFKEHQNYEALAHLNLARDLYDNLFQLGVLPSGKEYQKLATLSKRIEAAIEEQERVKEDKAPPSYLKALQDEGKDIELKKKVIKKVMVFLFGLDRAGKTTFVEFLKDERYKEHAPTLGMNLAHLVLGNVSFEFNDLGGQVALRPTWMNYWKNQDVIVFMVDAADSARFPEANRALKSVIERPEPRGKPLLVLASKVDLPEAKPRVVVETALGLHEISKSRNDWAMYEISIKSNVNVDRALNYIVSIVMQDADVERFISKELKRLVKNYKEMFKAYMNEAKQLEGKKAWDECLDRLYKARAIQEELFKQGDGKAQKEIKKIADTIRRIEIHV